MSFYVRVSMGYDSQYRQIIRTMTYKAPRSLTERQAEKEAQKRAILFEEECKRFNLSNRRAKFEELAEEWLSLVESTKKMKPSTIAFMKTLRKRTYEGIGHVYVDKLTYRHIQNFILSLTKKGVSQKTGGGLSQKTQKHYVSFISDVLKYAINCGMISESPCRNIEIVKTEQKEKNIYTLEEEKLLLSRIDEKAKLEYRVYFNLLAYLGLRRGEALGLEYKDINFETGLISIVRTSNYSKKEGTYTSTPKTNSSIRSMVAPPKVLELIKELKVKHEELAENLGDLWTETDRLFIAWDGKPMHPNTPYNWLERFCKSEGLPFKGLHSFRHTLATQTITNGVDIKTVSSLLGHSVTSTTLNIYAHAVQDSNAKALNLMADLLE